MNNYILTFDYELFGSGKGCVIKHLINPTNKILKALDKENVKATFFVEQLELDAIMALQDRYPRDSQEYKNARMIKDQVLDLAKRGHDVQLHLHPQWYGAKYKDGKWQLNFNWWRFSSLPYRTQDDGTPGKFDLIQQGKSSLETLIKTVNPEYNCIAFRAGGYNVGSDPDSLQALLDNGFMIDSSVCPGYFTWDKLCQYDYTQVSHYISYWGSDICLLFPAVNPKSGSVYQLPLLTMMSTFQTKLSFARVFNQIVNKRYKSTGFSQKNYVPVLSSTEITANSNFDLCLSSRSEIRFFEQKIKSQYANSNTNEFITLIGHPKDYNVFSAMPRILKKLREQNVITVVDFSKEIVNAQ
ncbi:MAG: hypothetical protein HRU24_05070 [Gammaproteobacteria bacterium]|nr:hypothetical protein [Gammaproteobacteria bacterium]